MSAGGDQLGGRARREVMDLASEDATPLFDVTATFRAGLPGASDADHRARARALVGDLLAHGHVTLEYDDLQNGRRAFEPVPPAEVERELADDSNWHWHGRRSGRWITIHATGEFAG